MPVKYKNNDDDKEKKTNWCYMTPRQKSWTPLIISKGKHATCDNRKGFNCLLIVGVPISKKTFQLLVQNNIYIQAKSVNPLASKKHKNTIASTCKPLCHILGYLIQILQNAIYGLKHK